MELPLAGDYWGQVLLTGCPGLQRNLPIHYHCWHDRYLLCISIKDGCDLEAYYIMTPFIISRKPIWRLLWGLYCHITDRSSISHIQENLYNDSRCNIYMEIHSLLLNGWVRLNETCTNIIIHTIIRNTTFYGKAEEVFHDFWYPMIPKEFCKILRQILFSRFSIKTINDSSGKEEDS